MEKKNKNILQPILNLIELLAENFGTLLVKTFHYLALFFNWSGNSMVCCSRIFIYDG